MRRKLFIIAAVLCLMPLNACAQWWLFPGSKGAGRDSLSGPDSIGTAAAADTLEAVVDEFVLDIPEMIKVSLILPLKSVGGKSSANFYEYYFGALMAARELGQQGIRIDLNVFDSEDSNNPISDIALQDSDLIIGPVSTSQIEAMSKRCPDKYIVSPMEPKAAGLADSLHIVQAPVPWEDQVDELIAWINAEKRSRDAVVVLTDALDLTGDNTAAYMLQKLAASGLEYTSVASSHYDIKNLTGTIRFLVASDNDSFICSAVNNIANAGLNKGNVALYGLSRMRTMDGISSESLYNANARIASGYYIDYTAADIKRFLMTYRAFFKNEPSSFAFSGYDTMKYFVNICNTYGRQWYKKLPEYSERGLQTDFRFVGTDKSGAVNSAVRKLTFSPDLSTSLE